MAADTEMVPARIGAKEAERRLRACGFEPLAPYPGLRVPWPARCIAQGHEVSPTLYRVQAGAACRFCIGHVPIPEAVADAELAAAGVRRVGPWRGASVPVEVICTVCGHRGTPRLDMIRYAGQGGCAACARRRRGVRATAGSR